MLNVTRRRQRSESGQVLILALAFLAFVAVLTVALLHYAGTTYFQHQRTEATATVDSLAEGGAAFAAADAIRPNAVPCSTKPSTSTLVMQGNGAVAGDSVAYKVQTCYPGSSSGLVASQCGLCILNTQAQDTALGQADSLLLSGSVNPVVAAPITINGPASITGSSSLTSMSTPPFIGCGVSASNCSPNSFFHPTPTAITPISDPLGGIGVPPTAGLLSQPSVNLTNANTQTIGPGIYDSIYVTGTAHLTMTSGVYVIKTSFMVDHSGCVTTAIAAGGGSVLCPVPSTGGVLLYLACPQYPSPCPTTPSNGAIFGATGAGNVNLLPYFTSGSFASMVMFFDRNDVSTFANPGVNVTHGSAVISGMVYGSQAAVVVAGGASISGALVVGSLNDANSGGVATTLVSSTSLCNAYDASVSGTRGSGGSVDTGRVIVEAGCGGATGIVAFNYTGPVSGSAAVTLVTPSGPVTSLQPAFSGAASNYISPATVTVTVCPGSTVPCGGSATVFTTTTSSGTWSVTPGSALAEGQYAAQAQLTDNAGNVASSGVGGFTIDVPPTVASISLASSSPTNASSVQWTVTFSKSVTGVALSNFGIVKSGLGAAPALTALTGSGAAYTVTASTGTGTGTLGLNLVAIGSIKDAAGTALNASLPVVGSVYDIDRTAPTVSSIALAGSTPTSASSVQWTVTFSEAVTGVASVDFGVVNTGLGGTPAVTSVTGSGATYTVSASTGTGIGTLGLNLTAIGTIRDTALNSLSASLPTTGPVYHVDKTAPTVTSLQCGGPSCDGLAASGDQLIITFSKPLAPTIPTTNVTVTETRSGNGHVFLTISGIAGSSDTGTKSYLLRAGTSTFTGGTAVLSAGNTVITVTLGVQAGTAEVSAGPATFAFVPATGLTDTLGNQAVGMQTAPSMKLF